MPGALSSEVCKPQSANGYKEGIGLRVVTGQFHLTQVISAFQDSKAASYPDAFNLNF